jgi:peptidoglycan/xylan/chitin deacetylase (PgdA/CDA1 family)
MGLHREHAQTGEGGSGGAAVSARTTNENVQFATAEVPMLMYHSIGTTTTRRFRSFAVDSAEFAEQMDYLDDHGYQTVTAGEIAERQGSGTSLPERPVVLTFDDAYEDFYTAALPVLRKHGFSSTLFVPTGCVGTTAWFNAFMGGEDHPMMSWAALSDALTEGVEIAAHSHTHPHLDLVPGNVVRDEVNRSRGLLEDHLGVAVEGFAYPFGYWNRAARAAVADGGFRYAVAVADLRVSPGDDMFTLPRLTVRAGIGVAGLARLLSTPTTLRRRGVSRARRAASRAVRRVVPVMGSSDAREGPASG